MRRREASIGTLAAVLAATLAGCLAAPPEACLDGLLCPADQVCLPGGGCALVSQVAACADAAELAPCTFPGTPDGVCANGLCVAAGCGNRVVEPARDEVCDDGNLIADDACRPDCRSTNACGNGEIDPVVGEQCDDGNQVDADGCQADCRNPRCGDGVLDAALFEGCDEGAANADAPDATCRTSCQPARCGDGVIDPTRGERCDDGGQQGGDGCSFDCTSLEVCGNEYVDFAADEQCDAGAGLDGDGCASSCTLELSSWTEIASGEPGPRGSAAFAFDPGLGRAVLFGGETNGGNSDETWSFDGRAWLRVATAHAPLPREGAALAWHPGLGRLVLFGGSTDEDFEDDTWLFDGIDWTEQPTAHAPSRRRGASLAWHPGLGKLVLFGGESSRYENDTWAFDGTDWTELAPATRPPPRYVAGLVWDASRDALVLFGGDGERPGGGYLMDDTWTFDGTTWTQLVTPQSPPGRFRFAMGYDAIRARVVVWGGFSAPDASVWELGPSTWEVASVAPGPTLRGDPSAIYDPLRGQLVVFGGFVSGYDGSTWTYDGASWQQRGPTATPSGAMAPPMVDAPTQGQLVMCDGGQTRVHRGGAWLPVITATTPPARAGHALAYDAGRAEVVLFGGVDATYARLAQTWVFDGATWTQRFPATSPAARTGSVFVPHAGTDRVILFGGEDGALPPWFGDTWAWDGVTWTELTPAVSPSARRRSYGAYDSARDRVVLFGGDVEFGDDVADTWTFDGNAWTEVAGAGAPTAEDGLAVAFDPLRGAVIAFGGARGIEWALDETWAFDGVTWSQLATANTPPGRTQASLVFDPRAGHLVLWGGDAVGGSPTTSWAFDLRSPYPDALVPAERCLHAEDDRDGDGLAGCADPDCWGWCRPHCPPGSACDPAAVPVGQPHCGDGTCDRALETAALCPDDCEPCGDAVCGPLESPSTCAADCP